jgi:hypothetical protein
MNEDLQLTDEQLRLITSRSLSEATQLESEAATAREAFLALGAAIEAAAADLDEKALVRRIEENRTGASIHPAQNRSRYSTNAKWVAFLVGGVLAASILIAIVQFSASISSNDYKLAVSPQPNGGLANQSEGERNKQSSFGWNDPLDDEIAVAALAIDQIGGRNRAFDNSIFDMNQQLEALSQELLRESL